jgi:GAF domain-containing protein
VTREELLARTFVDLADIWGAGIDEDQVSRLVTTRCVELFDAAAAGVLLSGADGQVAVSASSSGQMHRAELHELQVGEGPCLECYRTDRPVISANLRHGRRWQRFTPVALDAGYLSVHALPIHARGQMIGALNLFRAEIGTLSGADVVAAQALADACAITIIRQRALPDIVAEIRADQHDHNVVEQAKGALAARAGVDIDEAFRRIGRYARHHNLQLIDVCQELVAGTLNLVTILETDQLRHPSPGS